MNSNLFSSIVIHERYIPFINRFKYNVMSMYIDYNELAFLTKRVKLFSYNKFNLFSFNEIDHGYRNGKSLNPLVFKSFRKKVRIGLPHEFGGPH